MNNMLALPINLSVGTFDSYLSLVARMPKLSAEHEYDLAVRYRDDGDIDAARELVMSNLRFVAHLARGYSGYGLPLADIVQEGNIGLMKAVKRFDPDMGWIDAAPAGVDRPESHRDETTARRYRDATVRTQNWPQSPIGDSPQQ